MWPFCLLLRNTLETRRIRSGGHLLALSLEIVCRSQSVTPSKLTVAKNKHFICSLWMCRNKGCAFLIHAGSLLLFFFFFNRPFPTQNKVWTLQIQSLKLKRTFFWQGHQEHKASRKHIEGSTPVELIMTKLPLRLWAAFYSLLCTWLWFPWI